MHGSTPSLQSGLSESKSQRWMNHRLPVHACGVGCVVHDGLVSSAATVQSLPVGPVQSHKESRVRPTLPDGRGPAAHSAPKSPPEPSAPLALGSRTEVPDKIHSTPSVDAATVSSG